MDSSDILKQRHSTNLKQPLMFLLSLGILGSVAPAQAETASPQSPTHEVASRLMGDLIHAQDSSPDIRMRSCEIKFISAQSDAVYLYQEQARVDRLKQPYRQRFLRLFSKANNVISESYRLVDTKKWIGLCDQDSSQRVVSKSEVSPSHCIVTLTKQGKTWLGTTPPEGCPTKYRGASIVRNKIELPPNGMKTYDQGFNDQGEVVWGSVGDPYVFTKKSTGE